MVIGGEWGMLVMLDIWYQPLFILVPLADPLLLLLLRPLRYRLTHYWYFHYPIHFPLISSIVMHLIEYLLLDPSPTSIWDESKYKTLTWYTAHNHLYANIPGNSGNSRIQVDRNTPVKLVRIDTLGSPGIGWTIISVPLKPARRRVIPLIPLGIAPSSHVSQDSFLSLPLSLYWLVVILVGLLALLYIWPSRGYTRLYWCVIAFPRYSIHPFLNPKFQYSTEPSYNCTVYILSYLLAYSLHPPLRGVPRSLNIEYSAP